ncbi:hypothetical protein 1 [Wenling tombus-like virus 2]|uniref:hypothetical protein 1 n=1 Tax=Wenling tombus-like virus 2 TaxID=1923544 RepID=UPI00090C0A48|nr:hypothetical protein 1 [Wenling tombus-like virus 2]APG76586.1 hypothetical protein 1 [Wenling tombus-like virus 2]
MGVLVAGYSPSMAYHRVEIAHPFEDGYITHILPEIEGWIAYDGVKLVERVSVEDKVRQYRQRIPQRYLGKFVDDFRCCLRIEINEILSKPGLPCLKYQQDVLMQEREKNADSGVVVHWMPTSILKTISHTPAESVPTHDSNVQSIKEGTVKSIGTLTEPMVDETNQTEPQSNDKEIQKDPEQNASYVEAMAIVEERVCPSDSHETKYIKGNNKAEDSDKALKAGLKHDVDLRGWHETFFTKLFGRLHPANKRKNLFYKKASSLKLKVDVEAYWYLVAKLMFVPRDTKFTRTASLEYDKYMKKFDLTLYTMEERALMKARVVAAIIPPIPETMTLIPSAISNGSKIRKFNQAMRGHMRWKGREVKFE